MNENYPEELAGDLYRTPGPSPRGGVRRRVQAAVAARQLQAIKDTAERQKALPVRVVSTDNDLSRRAVLLWTLTGTLGAQVLIRAIEAALR